MEFFNTRNLFNNPISNFLSKNMRHRIFLHKKSALNVLGHLVDSYKVFD